MQSNCARPVRARPTVCAAAVAAALTLLAAEHASAQQAPATDKGNVVVVSGTRQSVASAIDRKKNASTVVDSIVAEDIGEFPDKNVGEALSRVTGVQLSRDFGEGSQVNIRGVEANLNRIEINGLSVLSTNGTAGRGAELRELPAELIKSIDVFKGVTADQTEGGIGGTVSIKTNMPLDFKKRTVVVKLEGEHSTNRGGVQPRGSLLLADRFLDGRLGLMANLVYDKVYTQNDYVRNSNWRYLRDWDNSPEKTNTSLNPAAAAVTSKAGCAALTGANQTACNSQWFDYSPGVPRYGIWTRDHKRSSAELTAQYKITDNLDVWARYNKNTQKQMLNDRNYSTDFGALQRFSNGGVAPVYGPNGVPLATPAATCADPAAGVTPAGMTFANHVMTGFTSGTCQNVAGQGASYNFDTAARDFALNIDSNYRSAGFNWKNSAWSAEALVAKSDSFYDLNTNLISMAANIPGLKVALDDQGLPKFTFPAGYDPNSSSTYTRIATQYQPSFTDNTEDQVKLDLKYRPNLPFLKTIAFGGQGRRSTSDQYRWTGYQVTGDPNTTADDVIVRSPEVRHEIIYDPLNTSGVLRNNGAIIPGSGLTANNTTRYVTAGQLAQLVDSIRTNTPGSFLNGYDGLSGYPNGWMAPSFGQAAQYFDLSRFNHDLLRNSIGSDGKSYPMPPQFAVQERVRAFYVRADFSEALFGVEWDGNVGVRYAGTRTRATGLSSYRSYSTNASSGARVETILANQISTFENKYSDVLPSFNLAGWLVPDKLVARIGWGKVMARPFIDRLTPTVNCIRNSGQTQFGGDGSADDCTGGNVNLKPFRATNKDASVEWYPSRDSQLSLAFFRKDIRSYIQNDVVLPNVDVFGDGTLWDLKTSINSEGATTKGWELAGRTALTMLPGLFGGLGLDANYTRMSYAYAAGKELLNPLDNTVLPYPGMSRNSYNVGVWYDLGQWNARLAYNYRDGYYTGTVDSNASLPVYGEKVGFLDAKLQFRATENLTVSVEGKNLTDEGQYLNAGSTSRRNELAWSGRRYFVGATYKF
ncbi:TonB-dependent receptor [Pseudoduganella lurida]|uniref:TonB-dependent receptor n=1 Tax=Pseudoduganella lurida TaxID=1036180 RepID=A0A562RK87_9BURK|nr:TonB-dependent receptor [Pseudoduganella lurida]TWI69475.1 TonB-dependent receptor [Pseudoduganella lurida]